MEVGGGHPEICLWILLFLNNRLIVNLWMVEIGWVIKLVIFSGLHQWMTP